MTNSIMEVWVATWWCNLVAQDLNACQRSVMLKQNWLHIQPCVGAFIHTSMTTVMQIQTRSCINGKDQKPAWKYCLNPPSWMCTESGICSERVKLVRMGRMTWIPKCTHFRECGNYGPWTCRICRGRRSRPAGPEPARFHRWSLQHQTLISSEGWQLWYLVSLFQLKIQRENGDQLHVITSNKDRLKNLVSHNDGLTWSRRCSCRAGGVGTLSRCNSCNRAITWWNRVTMRTPLLCHLFQTVILKISFLV